MGAPTTLAASPPVSSSSLPPHAQARCVCMCVWWGGGGRGGGGRGVPSQIKPGVEVYSHCVCARWLQASARMTSHLASSFNAKPPRDLASSKHPRP